MRRGFVVVATWSLLALGPVGCGGPAQIGGDKEAFKAVDALYTAVGMRDVGRVEQCGATLRALHDSSKLDDGAFRSLGSIIDEAKGGRWEPALQRLSAFMEGQRR